MAVNIESLSHVIIKYIKVSRHLRFINHVDQQDPLLSASPSITPVVAVVAQAPSLMTLECSTHRLWFNDLGNTYDVQVTLQGASHTELSKILYPYLPEQNATQ
jgi:hypothetical protein